MIDQDLRRPTPDRPLPESTYRVQFHAGFTFRDAAAIVPYLHELGVTHLYASPYLKARPGSTHGYDVIDHCALNPELGTQADYDAMVEALSKHGMSHILDTVPNHVGVATNDNAWWNDVLERGPDSRYANYFDIAWRGSPRPELRDKVLLPVLGGPYGEVLEKGELRLAYEGERIWVYYYDRRFPVSVRSFQQIPGGGGSAYPTAEQVASFNGTPGDPRSFDRLDDLLNRLSYRLAYWRTASDEINYRRFFDINDLAALAMQRREVFEETHAFTFKLIAEGKVAGLRIDHPDGLYDPEEYFQRLQEKSPGLYVLVEKILAPDEPLPGEWPVHGTSGYDFLNKVNGLFVDGRNEEAFTRLYREWTGDGSSFEDLVYQKKKLILKVSLASELQMLAHQLDRLAQRDRRSRDFTHNGLRHALREVIACFPVYRSYVTWRGVSESDRAHVHVAVARAIARNPGTDPAVFHFVRDAVLQKYPETFDEEERDAQLAFAGKFQQLTAPATAKGVEDTAFYLYNRFVSLNEVGGEPSHFGVAPERLHAYLADRQARWPYAMSALSTHDTKRSEDVRARLNVLSEIPDEWAAAVRRWGALNAPHRRQLESGVTAPSTNDEYLIYQTLVGAWPLEPFGPEEFAAFVKRVQAYMQKAMREAKLHTSWVSPNAEYEAGMKDFLSRLLDEQTAGDFLRDFRPLQKRVADLGLLNSLSQTLLRLTASGVPDTYQGSELWDFSLVDPDNRRPVDYERRRRMLQGLRLAVDAALARELVERKEDGRVKLFVTRQALLCRREHPGLFSAGEYFACEATGELRHHVFAFARRRGDDWAVVAVPRLVTRLPGELRDVALLLPAEMPPGSRLLNVFTGGLAEVVEHERRPEIRMADAFAGFPVALLVSQT